MVLTKEQVAVLRELVNANEWNMGVWNNATGRNLPENMTGLLDTIDDRDAKLAKALEALKAAQALIVCYVGTSVKERVGVWEGITDAIDLLEDK